MVVLQFQLIPMPSVSIIKETLCGWLCLCYVRYPFLIVIPSLALEEPVLQTVKTNFGQQSLLEIIYKSNVKLVLKTYSPNIVAEHS